jgi:Zn-dependent M28 family amino/carboxypeptidase
LTAHYDAMSEDPYHLAPGADDNASGTVSLLVAASILKDYHFVNTVKFVAFAAEEVGLQGSETYAQEAYDRGDTIQGILNFDMIAYDGNADGVIHMYCDTASENESLAYMLTQVISDHGVNLSPTIFTERVGGDHAAFWDYGFPAVMVIEDCGADFNPYYHTTGDRVSAFDTSYYVAFTKAAVAGIATLAGSFMLGDANGDALIDLADVVYLLNFLFKGGFAPHPLQAGDANSDGTVQLGDAIYLLNYLFKGGPPPSG